MDVDRIGSVLDRVLGLMREHELAELEVEAVLSFRF